MFHRRWWWQPWPSCPYPPAKGSIKHNKWPHTPPTQSSSSIPISFPYFPLYLAKLPRIASSSAWAASSNSVNNSGCFKSRLCFYLETSRLSQLPEMICQLELCLYLSSQLLHLPPTLCILPPMRIVVHEGSRSCPWHTSLSQWWWWTPSSPPGCRWCTAACRWSSLQLKYVERISLTLLKKGCQYCNVDLDTEVMKEYEEGRGWPSCNKTSRT